MLFLSGAVDHSLMLIWISRKSFMMAWGDRMREIMQTLRMRQGVRSELKWGKYSDGKTEVFILQE